MTVKELIEHLKTQPQGALVAFKCFSEQCLLEKQDIELQNLCEPRPDGWIQNERPDMRTIQYLVFPGN